MSTMTVVNGIPVVFQGKRENAARRCVGLFDCLTASEDQERCQAPVVLQVVPRREEVVPVAIL